MAKKIIGTVTTYHGDEHRYLRGHHIKVLAVFKGAAAPDHDPDYGFAVATTDDEVARLGGVGVHDRVEVVPWIESEGRFSFASSDPRVVDLACFAELDGERVGGAA